MQLTRREEDMMRSNPAVASASTAVQKEMEKVVFGAENAL